MRWSEKIQELVGWAWVKNQNVDDDVKATDEQFTRPRGRNQSESVVQPSNIGYVKSFSQQTKVALSAHPELRQIVTVQDITQDSRANNGREKHKSTGATVSSTATSDGERSVS